MIGPYLRIEMDLTAVEPIQVGTGDFITLERPDGHSDLAQVARNVDGKPCLPGSALKGALRALASISDEPLATVDRLFGPEEIRDPEDARAGLLSCWTAHASACGSSEGAPYAQLHGEGVFVDARTAISPAKGTAEEHKLFHRQNVVPETRFLLRFGLSLGDFNVTQLMQRLLASLAADGLLLGGGRSRGSGLCRGDPQSLRVIAHGFDTAGAPTEEDLSVAWRGAVASASTLVQAPARNCDILLCCDGLFLSLDSSRLPRRGQQEALRALREPGKPDSARLPATSLKGALRAKAVWLERLADPTSRDNRDLILSEGAVSDSDLSRPHAVCGRIEELSTSELLFGVSGWRGMLSVRDVRNESQSGWRTVRSVKLDRFSGEPIRGALFSVEAALAPRFAARLTIEGRAGWNSPGGEVLQRCLALFDRLCQHLQQQGLMLGHGVNRGYGWFDVRLHD